MTVGKRLKAARGSTTTGIVTAKKKHSQGDVEEEGCEPYDSDTVKWGILPQDSVYNLSPNISREVCSGWGRK